MSICRGVAGFRGHTPKGVFIHNDAGSRNANASYYGKWLVTHDLELGFAHYYVASDGILQAEDDCNCAWHCGQTDGNTNYLSIEVCQSMGDINIFKANEDRALKMAADKCKQYGIVPSNSTIRLHQEVYATACPHRSADIHGGASATKDYFVKRITEIMKMGMGEKKGEVIMVCFYRITDKDRNKVYYFDGSRVHPLNHPDERKVLNDIYKDNNGKDIPEYFWNTKAPWYTRLKQVIDRVEK